MPIYLNNAKVEQVRTGVTPSPAGSPPLAPTADGAVGTSTDYARADHQHPSELPSGGSAGQVLTKTASGEAWADAPSDASLAETVAALQKDLGTGGKNCRVAWGSYTGTGVYGASHPNSIACDFTPVLLAVYNKDSNNITPVFAFREMTEFGYNSSGGVNAITWGERGVSWYVTSGNTLSVNYQMNASGKTYHYLIIGYAAEDEAAE